MTVLDRLAEYAKLRVEEAKRRVAPQRIKELALSQKPGDFEFEKALSKPGVSFICECKKASPSKGVIAEEYPYVQIAEQYQTAGADAVSVLTEPKWFLGAIEHLERISGAVSVPCLRKDFTVDEYMVYEAKTTGAKAVLLICALLPEDAVRRYIEICDKLGISAVVEAHDEAEVKSAVNAGARIIGVNNRNLRDFSVDTQNTRRLRDSVPQGVLFVAESGVKDRADIQAMAGIGADAVLIGEALMRAQDKAAKLRELKNG